MSKYFLILISLVFNVCLGGDTNISLLPVDEFYGTNNQQLKQNIDLDKIFKRSQELYNQVMGIDLKINTEKDSLYSIHHQNSQRNFQQDFSSSGAYFRTEPNNQNQNQQNFFGIQTQQSNYDVYPNHQKPQTEVQNQGNFLNLPQQYSIQISSNNYNSLQSAEPIINLKQNNQTNNDGFFQKLFKEWGCCNNDSTVIK
jgi:hypothetical protein